MIKENVNIDFCGINNLLNMLEQNDYSKAEIQKIATRIVVQTGADIIIFL